jgi:hypothetical protein
LTVIAVDGENVVEFVDANTKKKPKGAIIDNVGVFGWKKNALAAVKEIDAVMAGGSVSWSSFLNEYHDMYQLDRDETSRGIDQTGWCPITYTAIGSWIQVTTETPK